MVSGDFPFGDPFHRRVVYCPCVLGSENVALFGTCGAPAKSKLRDGLLVLAPSCLKRLVKFMTSRAALLIAMSSTSTNL